MDIVSIVEYSANEDLGNPIIIQPSQNQTSPAKGVIIQITGPVLYQLLVLINMLSTSLHSYLLEIKPSLMLVGWKLAL